MILNLRPVKPEILTTVIEQMEDRFPGDDLQCQICDIIAEVLGKPNSTAERQAMTDNAAVARKEQHEPGTGDAMDVDG